MVAQSSDLQRVFAQIHEVQQRLLKGSISPVEVRRPLQKILDGTMFKQDGLQRYDCLLLSLADQLELIREFNARHWKNFLSEEQLRKVCTISHEPQSLRRLDILYVDFGSPEKTLSAWKDALYRTELHNVGIGHLENPELTANTKRYRRGIHRVSLDLLAHWSPD
ncbi:MAG TPA: hypothetical protein VH144_01940, partial [Candidatus Saccharimonadales bacterium]|nr:hypothetical protein [Candidatus Saccharimonadales bacterium]